MRVLAVGDIHTKTWIFDLVESVVNDYDAVVFCGDYADDWSASALDSLHSWDALRKLCLAYPTKVKAVRGNHDYIYTEDTPTMQSGYNYSTQTLLDAPENRELKDWLRDLPLILELDGVHYAHAGIDERWDGSFDMSSIWKDTSPIWTRPDWAQYKKIPQVVGHTPQKTINEVRRNIWLIDTFSTYPNGYPIGDGSMLVVTDGISFEKININANHNHPSSFEGAVS
jgi:hypothetical protein